MWVLIAGNLVEGFIFIGPFKEHDGPDGAFEAGRALYGDDHNEWCTAPVKSLEQAAAEEAKVQAPRPE